MNTILVFVNCILAVLTMSGTISRCIWSTSHGTDLRAKFNRHAWVTAHVMIGTGAFGYLCAKVVDVEPKLSVSLLFFGLCVLFLFPWQRRKGDR